MPVLCVGPLARRRATVTVTVASNLFDSRESVSIPTTAAEDLSATGEADADTDTAEVGQKAPDEGDAARAATKQALESDELLLDQEAQKLAARANEDLPFGVPGKPLDRLSLLRAGFAVTVGVLCWRWVSARWRWPWSAPSC